MYCLYQTDNSSRRNPDSACARPDESIWTKFKYDEVTNDSRSSERNLCNCIEKPEKFPKAHVTGVKILAMKPVALGANQ